MDIVWVVGGAGLLGAAIWVRIATRRLLRQCATMIHDMRATSTALRQ